MGNAGKSEWRRRYDKSIKDEEVRIADSEENESAWSLLVAAVPSTGTAFDLLFLPIIVVAVGVSLLRRHRRKESD